MGISEQISALKEELKELISLHKTTKIRQAIKDKDKPTIVEELKQFKKRSARMDEIVAEIKKLKGE